jgi:hypothetical protein
MGDTPPSGDETFLTSLILTIVAMIMMNLLWEEPWYHPVYFKWHHHNHQ